MGTRRLPELRVREGAVGGGEGRGAPEGRRRSPAGPEYFRGADGPQAEKGSGTEIRISKGGLEPTIGLKPRGGWMGKAAP